MEPFIKIGKAGAAKLPVFPRIEEEMVDDNIVTFKSTVHIHHDKGHTIDIYLLPVVNTYIFRSNAEKTMGREAHLRECLRNSKYFKLTPEFKKVLLCIDTLVKGDHTFLQKLYQQYP